ncbi:unnamed protein product [Gemmata massiliana]|uniref:Uncharacterized protein n=1 Tax=Gemmata massiliana TaxID=1210884 RepID=A0A6P2CY94_9BACT|nr:unnamed protein product [Gemmata massiliana]
MSEGELKQRVYLGPLLTEQVGQNGLLSSSIAVAGNCCHTN